MSHQNVVSKDLYPFQGQYLDVDGLKYHYLDEGDKDSEPIVMVHGNPTWSFYYRNLVKRLSPTYRVIVPDHIGFGLSSKPSPLEYGFTLKDRVDDLTRLIESLDLKKKITLVVHDWGGMVGLAWARKRPELIKKLIILNTSGFHLPAEKKLPATLNLGRNTRLGAGLILRANAFTRSANHLCVHRTKLSSKVKQGYLAPHPKWQDRYGILNFVRDIPLKPGDPSYDLVSETQAKLKAFINTPTLILWGAKDFVFDDHFLKEWQERLPKAKVHRISDAGHYVLEDAFEECMGHIEPFLASKDQLC